MSSKYFWVYVTAKDMDEARRLAQGALKERLAACANLIGPIESHYWWEGKLEEATEVALILKTEKKAFEALSDWIVENHSYDKPCVVALPIEGGSEPYLKWISDQLVEQ